MPDLSKYRVVQILMFFLKGVLASSPEAFGKTVNCGKTKVYEELNSGRLRAKKLGDKTLIPFWSGIDWLESLPDYPVATTTEEVSPSKTLAELRQLRPDISQVDSTDAVAAAVKILTGDFSDD